MNEKERRAEYEMLTEAYLERLKGLDPKVGAAVIVSWSGEDGASVSSNLHPETVLGIARSWADRAKGEGAPTERGIPS
jgi:hypothetical protein